MLIAGCELGGRLSDVRLAGGRVAEVGPGLAAERGEQVMRARGGALLPGLHDHHTHLLALAASLASVACGPPAVGDERALARALRAATPEGGWIRGTGYHESVAGTLTRERIDALRGEVPVRIQHRSGACWMLNGAALARLGLGRRRLEDRLEEGVERGARGEPTGRLFRLDGWLRERVASGAGAATPPALAEVGARLARLGVTGVTDATPANGPVERAFFAEEAARGALPQRVVLMGSEALPCGWRKLVLDERSLPSLEALVQDVRAAHARGRPVAIHCVTRSELLLAAAALAEAGARPGDRIEHASVAPPEAAAALASLGVTVVTQPGFVHERGDAYLRDVDPDDQPWLYRGAGLLGAGVALGAGTDAPFGDPDPWAAMRAATDRTTRGGAKLGPEEALSPERALALFTTPADAPGGAPRRVAPGAPADLVLLHVPWMEARGQLSAELVAATFVGGERAAAADPG